MIQQAYSEQSQKEKSKPIQIVTYFLTKKGDQIMTMINRVTKDTLRIFKGKEVGL